VLFGTGGVSVGDKPEKTPDFTITVPVPDHAEFKVGTLSSVIRQAGLPLTLFES
jgi:hypothetical protein